LQRVAFLGRAGSTAITLAYPAGAVLTDAGVPYSGSALPSFSVSGPTNCLVALGLLASGSGTTIATVNATAITPVLSGDVTYVNSAGTSAPEGDEVSYSVENIIGGIAGDILIGSAQTNVIRGGPGADYIDGVSAGITCATSTSTGTSTGTTTSTSTGTGTGTATRATYAAGAGDQLYGDDGNDWFYMDTSMNCGVTVQGGNGNDTADFSGRSAALTLSLDNLANDGDTNEQASIGKNGDIEVVLSGSGNDTLTADLAGSELHGGPGNDTLNGGAAADTLVGGPGADTILGNGGNNLINEGCSQDTQLPSAFASVAAVPSSSGSLATPASFAYLAGFTTNPVPGGYSAGVDCGTGKDFINGGPGNNKITYAGRNDALTIGLCTDTSATSTLAGGGGCAATNGALTTITGSVDVSTGITYTGTPGIVVTVYGASGKLYATPTLALPSTASAPAMDSDLVTALANSTLGSYVTLTGTSPEYLTLTMPASVTISSTTTKVTSMTITAPATGASGVAVLGFVPGATVPENDEIVNCNWLVGGAGNDNLTASSVSCIIEGGDGDDTITGGAGDDTLYGDYGCDTINGGGGTNTIDSGSEYPSAAYVTYQTANSLSLVSACGSGHEVLTGGTSDSDGNLCVCEDVSPDTCTMTNCGLM
jgi:Ca2+-binding RTX toxin-like protein